MLIYLIYDEGGNEMRLFRKRFVAVLLAATLVMPVGLPTTKALADSGEKEIQILATSDLHGKFVAWDYAANEENTSGSLAQVATLIKERKNANTVLIDVGDTIESNSSNLFFDEEVHPMIAGFNLLGYDFWTAGNHEFNYGVDTLVKVAKQFKGTFLCGNVYDKSTKKPIGDNYKVIERNGIKIAVIGYVTPNITRWDADNLSNYTVTNPIDEMKETIKAADQEADIVVAALHMGVDAEYGVEGSGAEDFAKAFPELDVILAAHGHEQRNEEINGVLVIENKNSGQTLADVDLTVKPDGKGGYDVSKATAEMVSAKDVASDATMVNALAKYDTRAKKDAITVVGELKGGDLVPETEIPGITQSQIQETAMINLINQVQMYYGDAEVSAAAAFSSNANMKEGQIRKSDNTLIYKYDNTLYRLEMTGKQLKQYMEWSANYYNTYKEGDLTISFNENMRSYLYDMFGGVKYEINISKEPGSRIENLTRMDGTAIKDTDKIVIAVNNYRANSQLLTYGSVYKKENGDTLPKLLEKDVHAGKAVRDMIGEWITVKNNGVIYPELSGNWKITGNDWNVTLHNKAAELVKSGKIAIPTSTDGRTPNVKAITVDDIKDLVKIVEVKLDANGGIVATDKIQAVQDEAYGYLPTATKKGYIFKGWYTAKTDGTKVTAKSTAEEGTLYARWSKATKPSKVKITNLKAGTKKATLKFDAVKGANGYRVYYSTDKNFKNAKSLYVTKNSAILKNLKSGKTYYVKVKAYKVDSTSAKVYGKASAVKTVKVK